MTREERIKDQVRRRDGYKCVRCGMTNEEHKAKCGRQLDVHRIVPNGLYILSNCQAMCKGCHAREPRYPTEVQEQMCLDAGFWSDTYYVRFPKDLYRMLWEAMANVGARSQVQYVGMRLRRIIEADRRRTPTIPRYPPSRRKNLRKK